jgi:hypothetical protein
MSYGIEILNNNDRIVIDTNYANFGFLSTSLSTATPGSSYPGLAGTVSSDLIVARANNTANGLVSRSINSASWATSLEGAASTTRYYAIRRFDSLNPSTASGYGFAVYNTSSNVIFTSNITKNFEIVAVGTFNSFVSNTIQLNFPSNTGWYSNFDKYYVVVNNTRAQYELIPSGVGFYAKFYRVCYNYLWANSTHGRITVTSYNYDGLSNLNFKINTDFHYMILKEIP